MEFIKKHWIYFSIILFIIGTLIANEYEYFNVFVFKETAYEDMKNQLPNYLLIAVLIERFVQGIILTEDNKNINEIRTKIKGFNKNIEIRRQLIEAKITKNEEEFLINNVNDQKEIKTQENNLIQEESEKSLKFNRYALLIGFILSVIGFRFFYNLIDNVDGDINKWALVTFDIFFTSILYAGGSKIFEEIMDLVKGFKIAKT